MPDAPLLRLVQLSVRVTSGVATSPVDVELRRGSLAVLRAAGSAIASRVLRAAAGLTRARSGHSERASVRSAYVFEEGGLIANLSLLENLLLPLRYQSLPGHAAPAALRRFGLSHLADARPWAVGSEARVLAQFARAEALDARLIYAERPFAGLSDLGRRLVEHWLDEQLDTGVGALLSDLDPTLPPAGVVVASHPTFPARSPHDK